MEARRVCGARRAVGAVCCATILAGSISFLGCRSDETVDRSSRLTARESRPGSADDADPLKESAAAPSMPSIDPTARDYARENNQASLEWRRSVAPGDPEKTQAALAEALADPEYAASRLIRLLEAATEREKAWIRDALLQRFEADSDPQVRQRCMLGMGWFRSEARALCVRALATDKDRGVRVLAASMLGDRGSEQEVGLLLQTVKEDKQEEQPPWNGRELAERAICALGEIGGRQAALALTEIWNNEEWSRGCRDLVLNSLGRTGDPASLDLLETTLQGSTDSTIRRSALIGVAHLAARSRTNPHVVERAANLLRRSLPEEHVPTRGIAIRGLGWIGGRDDIPLLEPFLTDNHTAVVIYSENGRQCEKIVYDIREDARKAIDEIEARLASK